MSDLELMERIFLAAAIGLLIGIERGWQEREMRDGGRVAGIRTFTLVGLLGGLCGLQAGTSPLALGLFFLAFALPFGAFEWRRAAMAGGFSATDFVTGLLTFALGAYSAAGNMVLAGACGVAATLVLAERRMLHAFLRHLKWTELRAALFLLVMTAILLPVLPDRFVDPWQSLNPHQIWLMTVLVGALSYAGYVAVRILGERAGLFLAAAMGGIVTSTTVTWTFARLARHDAQALPSIMGAILAAWIVSLLRTALLAGVIAPGLLVALAIPVLAAAGVLAVVAAFAWRAAGKAGRHPLVINDPLDLMLMLRFTLLLAAIMLVAKLVATTQSGLLALGGLSGLLDVDPITLSMARMAGTGVSVPLAISTILVAAAANGLAKSVLASYFGGRRLGLMLSLCALGAFAAGWSAFLRWG